MNIYTDSLTYYRHATFIIELNGKKILVDPMFGVKGSYPHIPLTKNKQRNPLIDLNVNFKELINVDGVLITHNHFDHFDKMAQKELPTDIPIFCQPKDFKSIKKMGFINVIPIESSLNWYGITIKRFSGTHGGGMLNFLLGKSSSYFVQDYSQNIYIAGDTLLTKTQIRRLKKIKLDVIITYGGGARFILFGKITMNHQDILKISQLHPNSKIIAMHMDSINHCLESSNLLRNMVSGNSLNIIIPQKNDTIRIKN